jgi:hypothetical protein
MNVTRSSLLAAALVVVATAGSASAGIISVASSVGGAPTGVIKDNLNAIPLGNGGGTGSSGVVVSFDTDGQAVVGTVGGQYAAPFLSGLNGAGFGNLAGVDTTTYLTTGLGKVKLAMPGPELYFGLLWGSVDAYNTLSFYNGTTVVGSLTGAAVAAIPNGDEGMNGTRYVNIGFDTPFNNVVASSSQYAFEFDNIAFNPTNPVPEPASMLLFGTGLLGMVRLVRRRK